MPMTIRAHDLPPCPDYTATGLRGEAYLLNLIRSLDSENPLPQTRAKLTTIVAIVDRIKPQ